MNFLHFQFTNHALVRAYERSVSIDDIKETIAQGEVIEEYPTDQPFPSFLSLMFFHGKPLHVCFAQVDPETCRIITVYEPDLNTFEPDFKTRKKR